MSVYEELEAAVLPTLTHYRDDLLVHDRRAIEEHPGVPFLHYSSAMNTHMALLPPASSYPPAGVWIPFLFGQADRWHLVQSVISMAQYFLNPSNMPERYTARYFNGRKLVVVTVAKALEIAREYRRQTEAEFNGKMVAA